MIDIAINILAGIGFALVVVLAWMFISISVESFKNPAPVHYNTAYLYLTVNGELKYRKQICELVTEQSDPRYSEVVTPGGDVVRLRFIQH